MGSQDPTFMYKIPIRQLTGKVIEKIMDARDGTILIQTQCENYYVIVANIEGNVFIEKMSQFEYEEIAREAPSLKVRQENNRKRRTR